MYFPYYTWIASLRLQYIHVKGWQLVLWSTQRLSTFMSTQRISRHVDIIFNISTKEQWKNNVNNHVRSWNELCNYFLLEEWNIIGSKTPHYNKLRALMNMYEGKLIMYACIIRETFVFYNFSASVSFDFETRIMSTCMSTSRSNYTDMSIWKKHADHSTSDNCMLLAHRP